MSQPAIRLRNSMTRKVEPFKPDDPAKVRLYLCGPTVYDRAHLGNARNVILFDVLARLLRHDYGADAVTYVRNVTDVDDKINARAAETGRPIRDITEETLDWFREDMAALGNLPPDHEPRATDHIEQMKTMIGTLIERGHAYVESGHVLFSVASYDGYGALSGRDVDDMIAGARVEVAPYKRDPMDFVLWKPSEGDVPGWDSPWGRGRPGWHIECSTMARELLGGVVDIHGGGNDLIFPHHENERAQSLCAHPDEEFARVWLHNEMLLVEGRKMSKSLGNFFTVRDLLEKGVPGEVIRFVFLSTHYSKPMDWTESKAREAEGVLRKWYRQAALSTANDAEAHPEVLGSLRDDLNTHAALAECHHLSASGDFGSLRRSLNLLGLSVGTLPDWADVQGFSNGEVGTIEDILRRRDSARERKDFSTADSFRSGLAKAGVLIKDGPDGTTYEKSSDFDINELDRVWGSPPDGSRHVRSNDDPAVEAVLAARRLARDAKDWARADALRDALVAAGVVVTDGLGRGWEAGPGFDPAKLEGVT